jgi:hypothetical protein
VHLVSRWSVYLHKDIYTEVYNQAYLKQFSNTLEAEWMRFDSRLQEGMFLGITPSGLCCSISGYLVSNFSRECSSLIFKGDSGSQP